jgi:hypothetical protein
VLAWIKQALAVIFSPSTKFTNVSNSNIFSKVYKYVTLIYRPDFICRDKWLNELFDVYYDDEIKSKYIPELHQEVDETKYRLTELLNYNGFLQNFHTEINGCFNYIERFELGQKEFDQILRADGKANIDRSKTFLKKADILHVRIAEITTVLKALQNILATEEFGLFQRFKTLVIPDYGTNTIQPEEVDLSLLFDEIPEDDYIARDVTKNHDQVYQWLAGIRALVNNAVEQGNSYIISGNAGSGKTNLCAHLINELKQNDEFVVFLKASLFSGDNLKLEEQLLYRIKIQEGYIFDEVLTAINNFAKENKKRCVIVIDALNETTKAGIGFSNIWRNDLQAFIQSVRLFPNLFFVCTLRTSYIEHIWAARPAYLYELPGFSEDKEVLEACTKYFHHYRIKANNLRQADLTHFKVPLLLDLFCKMTNPTRSDEVEITLGVETYVNVFRNYIDKLVQEVKNKLSLQKANAIKKGFDRSADLFCLNNQAIMELDEFNDAFDADDLVTQDSSIAKAVLEGYLIFIKDASGSEHEFIKHTQQEVGGYLLAKRLIEQYPNTADLVATAFFQENIIGAEQSNHHQLRLDIIKFLIALKPGLIQLIDTPESNNVAWWYVFNGGSDNLPKELSADLLRKEHPVDAQEIVRMSRNLWLSPRSTHNFEFITKLLLKQSQWNIDRAWTAYIYRNYIFFQRTIERYRTMLLESERNIAQLKLGALFCAYTGATTLRNLRDQSTAFLIDFGIKYPEHLLTLAVENAGVADSYIYERLVSSCYGVALNLQNDDVFIAEVLPRFAREFYRLQFAPEATSPVYNYIVIDSIKHLLELEFFKNATTFSLDIQERVNSYQFQVPNQWQPPTAEQQQLINQSSEHSWQEPIGMDFGIYTIPRLIDREQIPQRTAIANVYKRVYELGYQDIKRQNFEDSTFRYFYNGEKLARIGDKADRLGKKYSWMAFFDYAGYLLLNKKLAGYTENDIRTYRYERLGDVDIDISKPTAQNHSSERIFHSNLMAEAANDPNWNQQVKIELLFPLIQQNIAGNNYTMLYGKVDQRLNEEYKTRSFLLAESFFIARNAKTDAFKKTSLRKVHDWKNDVSFYKDDIRHIYFGELYWLGITDSDDDYTANLPTGEIGKRKRRVSPYDTFSREIPVEKINTIIEEEYEKTLNVAVQSSLCEYLWETNSEVFPGFSEYFPSVKMGKSLKLKVDPATGRILDENLDPCFEVIKYENHEYFGNDFNYMRSDLLKKYMEENNLTLVLQIKQHSYTEAMNHNRSMQYFLLNAEEIRIGNVSQLIN